MLLPIPSPSHALRLALTTAALALLFVSAPADAALIDRGSGFIYDDVLDITWTQDANINGATDWTSQVAWAASLSLFDSVRNVTWDDWRLADVDVGGDGVVIQCSAGNELACRDNEYGYLFHQYGVTPASPGLFTNLQAAFYWSGEVAANPANGHIHNFDGGNTTSIAKFTSQFGWAVRSGDVAAVPEPATTWLLGLGLAVVATRRASWRRPPTVLRA